jgi:hypothetical protein
MRRRGGTRALADFRPKGALDIFCIPTFLGLKAALQQFCKGSDPTGSRSRAIHVRRQTIVSVIRAHCESTGPTKATALSGPFELPDNFV